MDFFETWLESDIREIVSEDTEIIECTDMEEVLDEVAMRMKLCKACWKARR